MRKWLVILAVMAGCASLLPVYAQETSHIAYVDMKHVLDNAPQVVAGRERLDQEFRPRDDAVKADEQQLQAMQQQLAEGTGLDDESRTNLERDIRNLQRAVDRRREDLIEELNFRRNEIEQRLEETLELVIKFVAEAEGLDLVITDPVVLYYSPRIDITQKVLDRLKVEFEADQQELNGR